MSNYNNNIKNGNKVKVQVVGFKRPEGTKYAEFFKLLATCGAITCTGAAFWAGPNKFCPSYWSNNFKLMVRSGLIERLKVNNTSYWKIGPNLESYMKEHSEAFKFGIQPAARKNIKNLEKLIPAF